MYNKFTKHAIIGVITSCLAGNIYLARADDCVLQQTSTTHTTAVIAERTKIKSAVVPFTSGQKKCIVNFKARIGNTWYPAFGEYVWDGTQSSTQACGAAVTQAESSLIQRVNPTGLISEQVLICSENPEQEELMNTNVGSVVNVAELRPNPDRPEPFMYKGTTCRWFVDTVFFAKEVRNFQGIACSAGNDNWIVVDKF